MPGALAAKSGTLSRTSPARSLGLQRRCGRRECQQAELGFARDPLKRVRRADRAQSAARDSDSRLDGLHREEDRALGRAGAEAEWDLCRRPLVRRVDAETA